jgi:curli biogenesis system outer membrane secretion channel CsgG
MRRISLLGVAAFGFAIHNGTADAQPPVSERPTITVAVFDFGTVSTPVRGEYRPRGRHGEQNGYGSYEAAAFAEAIGTGVADILVEKLIESQRFRVFERKLLEDVMREQKLSEADADSIARARYIITGSVSHLGSNDKHLGGLLAGFGTAVLFRGLGMINTNQSFTTIRLTARVVDTRSGEIIGSFTGEGRSKKRWGVNVFGAGRGGLGGAHGGDRNFRETAIGEATSRATETIAEHVIALRATTLRP